MKVLEMVPAWEFKQRRAESRYKSQMHKTKLKPASARSIVCFTLLTAWQVLQEPEEELLRSNIALRFVAPTRERTFLQYGAALRIGSECAAL